MEVQSIKGSPSPLRRKNKIILHEPKIEGESSPQQNRITIKCVLNQKVRRTSRNMSVVDKGTEAKQEKNLAYNEDLLNKIWSFINMKHSPITFKNNVKASKKYNPLFMQTSHMLKGPSELVNRNVLPLPKSPIERRLNRMLLAKHCMRNPSVATTNRREPKKPLPIAVPKKVDQSEQHMGKSTIEAINSAIDNKLSNDKPIFVISTKNKRAVNKRCFLGKLIGTVQNRLPPILYITNRGDDTTLLPCITRSKAKRKEFLDLSGAPRLQSDDSMEGYRILRKKDEQNLSYAY